MFLHVRYGRLPSHTSEGLSVARECPSVLTYVVNTVALLATCFRHFSTWKTLPVHGRTGRGGNLTLLPPRLPALWTYVAVESKYHDRYPPDLRRDKGHSGISDRFNKIDIAIAFNDIMLFIYTYKV